MDERYLAIQKYESEEVNNMNADLNQWKDVRDKNDFAFAIGGGFLSLGFFVAIIAAFFTGGVSLLIWGIAFVVLVIIDTAVSKANLAKFSKGTSFEGKYELQYLNAFIVRYDLALNYNIQWTNDSKREELFAVQEYMDKKIKELS